MSNQWQVMYGEQVEFEKMHKKNHSKWWPLFNPFVKDMDKSKKRNKKVTLLLWAILFLAFLGVIYFVVQMIWQKPSADLCSESHYQEVELERLWISCEMAKEPLSLEWNNHDTEKLSKEWEIVALRELMALKRLEIDAIIEKQKDLEERNNHFDKIMELKAKSINAKYAWTFDSFR